MCKFVNQMGFVHADLRLLLLPSISVVFTFLQEDMTVLENMAKLLKERNHNDVQPPDLSCAVCDAGPLTVHQATDGETQL
mmetsp:Transcript_8287/g.21246  ORF Transcript_8287/g.21246 Transcript_8287/m.21246 type:complete len:80 (-) Transcript_8287:28-267(-)